MNTSETDIDLIVPAIFQDDPAISACFTLKNRDHFQNKREIPGLNLGYNTEEKETVVSENRYLLFRDLGLDSEWVALGNQVHGTRIRNVTSGGTYPDTDALVTVVPGLALGIQVADCAAILMGDSSNRVIAAVHAGWRGAAGDILPLTLDEMIRNGADPGNIKAFISPCISQKKFEVGEDVAEQFPDQFVDRKNFEKPHINLKSFLKKQMISHGMKDSHIEVDKHCTMDDSSKFYSYRREQEKSGRMFALIRLEQNP